MNFNYIVVDESFLNKLSKEASESLAGLLYPYYVKNLKNKSNSMSKTEYFKKVRHSKAKFALNYCAYCKAMTIIGLFDTTVEEFEKTKFCSTCGESNIFSTVDSGLEKVYAMIRLCSRSEDSFESMVLQHQTMVMIATKVECYLREYYKTFLNLTIVKSGISKVDKFEKECKNDFINLNKTVDRFKKELNINLKELLSQEDRKTLSNLFAYRNVIVHNNGKVDSKFKDLTKCKEDKGSTIELTDDDIERSLKVAQLLVSKTSELYIDVYETELLEVINDRMRMRYYKGLVPMEETE